MIEVVTGNLRKEFGDIVAVEDLSLEVQEGELLCLLGPSGCGKSTTLRMIAGLDSPTRGWVKFGDEDVTPQAPYDRDCSIVFQSWALFPYKTVLENTTFGLKMQGVDKEERINRAEELLELLEIKEFKDSRPKDLSGGQQQRVALARSLAMDPEVLLLDEPLSNLDKRLREQMQIELNNIHDEFEKTMVHVTHDQDEAFTLADRIGIMNNGNLIQVGEPREVYNNPVNQFVEEFLGETNIQAGEINQLSRDSITIDTSFDKPISVPIKDRSEKLKEGSPISLSIRPEIISMTKGVEEGDNGLSNPEDSFQINGTIDNILYRGSTVRYYINTGESELFVEEDVGSSDSYSEGDEVTLKWGQDDQLVFDAAGNTVWC